MEVIVNEGESIDAIVAKLSEAFRKFVGDPDPIYIPTVLYYIPDDDIKQRVFPSLRHMAEHCQQVFGIGVNHYRQVAVSFSSIPFCGLATMYLGDGSVIKIPELLNQPVVGTA